MADRGEIDAGRVPDEADVSRELGNAGVVVEAFRFARDAHEAIGQRRKHTGEPYIVHPLAVAKLVPSVPHTDAMLAAASLHDVVEDTTVTLEEIDARFGPEITELVDWLTDVSRPEDGNRAIREHLDLLHTATATPAAKTIKLADLIDNTRPCRSRARVLGQVLERTTDVLQVLRKGDPTLWRMAAETC